MAEKVKKRTSKSSCCVAGCSNTYRNTGEETHFYRFPAAIRFPGRKELWINAIRKVENGNGKNWTPSLRSLVCSMHFVGGKKSDHPQHPAYVPSIFPGIYTCTVKDAQCQILRFQRALKRHLKYVTKSKSSDMLLDEDAVVTCSTSSLVKSVMTSCCFPLSDNINISVFSCCMNGNDAATQACIPQCSSWKNGSGQLKELQKGDKCQIADRIWQGFKGYQSILTDDQLVEIAGVTKKVFGLLYDMIKPHYYEKSDNLNSLDKFLIFLMKLKLGLPSAALATIFGVNKTTISSIFGEVLDILVFKTQCLDYVFWPSRAVVRTTMPDIFREHFPECRAILDCTELRTELPSSVENQLHFYSPYTHCHSVKLLLAITPGGFISFVSQAYGGHSSNGFVTSDCGLLDLIEPGDVFISEFEFPHITVKLKNSGAVLVMPPFSSGSQFGVQQIKSTYKVTCIQKHVEKIVQYLKVYKVLDKIEIEQLPNIDKIIRICCVLINMQSPVIEMQMSDS